MTRIFIDGSAGTTGLRIADRLSGRADLELITLPEECELAVREKDGKTWLFVLNYAWEPQTICLKRRMKDMETGLVSEGNVELPAYGTKVYEVLC